MRTIAKDGKVVIERSGSINAEAAHYREAGPIDNGKILITVGSANLPGGFPVGGANRFRRCNTVSQGLPKTLRGMTANSVPKQSPGLNQDMVGGNQQFTARQYALS